MSIYNKIIIFKKDPIQWAIDHEYYRIYNFLRKLKATITALYHLRDYPNLRLYSKGILRLCLRGLLGLNEDLRVYKRRQLQEIDKIAKLQVYFSYTGSLLYPLGSREERMKPWYWPVTTTIYKMLLAFVLTAGIYHIVGYFWPSHELARGGLSGMIAFLIFLSLWKRDWL